MVKGRRSIIPDGRSIRERIISYLERSPNGTAQRRTLRRHFQNDTQLAQVYQDMIAQGIITERGVGKKNNPILVVLSQFRHTAVKPQIEPVRTTKQRIIDFLINTKDHASNKRDILKRFSYLEDFQEVYQAMIEDGILTEYGFGNKAGPKMVGLTFQYTFQNV